MAALLRVLQTRYVDMASYPADGYFLHEHGTKVQIRLNVQRQIQVKNKSAKLTYCISVWIQSSVTTILVNWFAS